MAWAFATLGVMNEPLMNAISAAALRKRTDYRTQNLSNTVWAYATLALLDGPLFQAISASSIANCAEFG